MKDKYGLKNINSNHAPTIALPLLNSTFQFTEFLGGVDTMDIAETDAEGLVHFIVRDTLFTYEAAGLLSAPDLNIAQGFDIEAITLDSIHANSAVALGDVISNMSDSLKLVFQTAEGNLAIFPVINNQHSDDISIPASDQFQSLTLSKGILTIAIENEWPADLTNVQIELKNQNSGVIIDTFIYSEIKASETQVVSADLNGKTLENDLTANIISMNSPGSTPNSVMIDSTDKLLLDIVFDSLEIVAGVAIFQTQELMNDSINMGFNLGNGEVISAITLKGGTFDYNFVSEVEETSQIQIDIPGLVKDDVAFNLTINLPAASGSASSISDQVDLTGYIISPSQEVDTNGLQIDLSASIISTGQMVNFDTSQSVSATINLQNLEIAKFEGDLGNRNISLAADTTNLSLSTGGMDGLRFTNPSISLNFKSSMGVPLGLDLSNLAMLNAAGDQFSLSGSITASNALVNAPSIHGNTETTIIALDKDNSNIADLISEDPNKIISSVNASLNPEGSTENFVLDSSKIELTMDMDIPLTVKMADFHAFDTIQIGQDMLSGVKFAEFVGEVVNGLPVDLDIQLYFMDATYTTFDSLIVKSNKFAPAGTVDVNGDVTSNTTTAISIMAGTDVIAQFNNAEYLLMDVTINTPDEGETSAKFITTSEIAIQLGIKVQAGINFNNDEDQ